RVRNAARKRDLDEDQVLVDECGMKKGVAAPIRRIDARAQIVPRANFMHRLVANDFFENDRGHGPVDAFQHEKSPIEPGTEKMDEIAIGRRKIAAPRERVEKMPAHLHKLAGSAGREINAANELLPPRLGGLQNL